MSSHRTNRRFNNTPPTPPLPPPSRYDPDVFQAAVSAVVAATMMQINTSGASGVGSGANPSNHGESHGNPRECSYKDFTNAKTKYFDSTKGVISLTRWFEKTKSVFEIYACPEVSKVKFATCTFMDKALSWWNGYVKSLSLPIANAMSWEDLKELKLVEYCPRGEVQKLEQYLWGLMMKESDDILCYEKAIR